MNETEAQYIQIYEQTDKACREVIKTVPDLASYIEEMKHLELLGAERIHHWDYDYRLLRQLKELREEILQGAYTTDCDAEDIEDLTDYYNRIMNRQDPISLLYKNQMKEPVVRVRQPEYYSDKRRRRLRIGLILIGIVIVGIFAVIWTLSNKL